MNILLVLTMILFVLVLVHLLCFDLICLSIGVVLCLVSLILKENGCIYVFILAVLRLLTGPPPVPFLVLINSP